MHSFDADIDLLRTRFARPLPGSNAQMHMASDYRRKKVTVTSKDKTPRDAAVLVVLYPDHDKTILILTVRRDHLKRHAGQVSFPGGRSEPNEALQETALREAHEEIGLKPSLVQILGQLTPLLIPLSNYYVYPFVGMVSSRPNLSPQDDEVARILHIPIQQLTQPETLVRERWTLRGREVVVPFYAVDQYKIWGATAMMLSELLALVS